MGDTVRRWHILLVDDDRDLLKMNRTYLEEQGFIVSGVYSGEECLEQFPTQQIDLILLDVGLQGISGFEVCRRLRVQENIRQPGIIMLTGMRNVSDKVTGLEMGADDYLVKPFDLPELLARVRAQLRIRDLQEKLVEVGKQVVVGQMAIALSHKINNPLSSIIWQARLLQDDLKALPSVPETAISALDAIARDAYRIEQVLKQLHRINKLSVTPYDGRVTMLDLDQSAPDSAEPGSGQEAGGSKQ